MQIAERLKQIRATMNMNQTTFAKSLGISQSTLAMMEVGKRDILERHIKTICALYNVDEHWLRTGEGTMLIETKDSFIDTLTEKYSLDELDRKIIQCYLELNRTQRSVIKNYLCNVTENISEEKPAETEINETASSSPSPTISRHELTDAEIDAECEDYRRQLEAEAFPADTDSSQKKA